MSTENIRIQKVKLEKPIPGFQETANFTHPKQGDIYLSSSSGKLALWRHPDPCRTLRVVLIPQLVVDVNKLPTGLLITSGRDLDHKIVSLSDGILMLDKPILADKWQANTKRNCPFARGTVRVHVIMFDGGLLRGERQQVEARSIAHWDKVAQFRVLGLCEGVMYQHETEQEQSPFEVLPNGQFKF
tara:strand:+ start:21304 stop:21861 length:558 start_codon:yes stop_codon:yes gene_type:complete